MADQFCLRWNNFQTNIVSALDSLKCSEDLVDVTLTCEGRNIKAHKVILSACSPYFRNVFKENPCQHPVIILKDVSADDIVSLLSYMYQGEVFIEESKLSSFLHTAALLQVKGLTGVTQQKENFTSPTASNKLYTQLTISSRSNVTPNQKDTKAPALKKRRSSTSDKPNDITIGVSSKKSKILVTGDANSHIKNSLPKVENPVFFTENSLDKKCEGKLEQTLSNGKSSSTQCKSQLEKVSVKLEHGSDMEGTAQVAAHESDNEDSLPDYENSMLARSLLSGINPSKSDTSANNKKVTADNQLRTKDGATDSNFNTLAKSPLKVPEEALVKSERHTPQSDMEYEPEILLSEQNDATDSENPFQDQTQALMLLAGMSSVGVPGASTSHGASNHAAICGDCPHCGMKYSNQSALKYHVRLMHSDLSNRLCCYLCPRSFTMRETFKEHMWSTHGQRN